MKNILDNSRSLSQGQLGGFLVLAGLLVALFVVHKRTQLDVPKVVTKRISEDRRNQIKFSGEGRRRLALEKRQLLPDSLYFLDLSPPQVNAILDLQSEVRKEFLRIEKSQVNLIEKDKNSFIRIEEFRSQKGLLASSLRENLQEILGEDSESAADKILGDSFGDDGEYARELFFQKQDGENAYWRFVVISLDANGKIRKRHSTPIIERNILNFQSRWGHIIEEASLESLK